VGWLFKSETRNTTRTNLLIFLTPYIVASPEEADLIYQKKSDMMEKVKEGYVSGEEPVEKPAEDSDDQAEGRID
jgi:general secretion pathway protein D